MGFNNPAATKSQRGFSRPVISHKGREITREHGQIDMLDDFVAVVSGRYILKGQQWFLLFNILAVWLDQRFPGHLGFVCQTTQAQFFRRS